MSFRLGLVGLCTSHPNRWVPIIRELAAGGVADCAVNAAWDSGETRPDDFAAGFCRTHAIPHAVAHLEEMLPLVDGVIVHSANWDRHLQQAQPFVAAGKSVFLDKPMVGNRQDAGLVLDWMKQGCRITGGSALRFTAEVAALRARLAQNGERLHCAYTVAGLDDFNYGIHAYALIADLMGPGIASARHFDSSGQKQILLKYHDGRSAVVAVGPAAVLPFNLTAASREHLYQLTIDNARIYHTLLQAVLPYLCGTATTPPLPAETLLEPELAALAARTSWMNHGQQVFLDDLRLDAPGYDGRLFAAEYRRSRITAAKTP